MPCGKCASSRDDADHLKFSLDASHLLSCVNFVHGIDMSTSSTRTAHQALSSIQWPHVRSNEI